MVEVQNERILFDNGTKSEAIRAEYCPDCPLNVICIGPESAGGSVFAYINAKSREKLNDKIIAEQANCVRGLNQEIMDAQMNFDEY